MAQPRFYSGPMQLAEREELESALEIFGELSAEAIIKQDVLRLGLRFDTEVFDAVSAYKSKDYFIFSFDLVPLAEMDAQTARRAPEEIRLSGGPHALEPTVISVRVNPESSYAVQLVEGRPCLTHAGQLVGDVEFHGIPKFYGEKLDSGKTISEIVPVLEWGYLLYITAYRLCQYWGGQQECRFCDINENYRQQRRDGRPYTAIKPLGTVLEALEHVARLDNTAGAYTLTGGSITGELQGQSEVDFYLGYIEAIETRFPGRWLSKAVVQAFELEDCRRLKAAGLSIYHPNYEVWDAKLFESICPGKASTIGRERWISRVVDAVEVFGPGRVIPNFVGGVEMSQPDGFRQVDAAVASTREGLEFFMSRGVLPRFTTWCPEPLSDLGRQAPPPLEYFCKLLLAWREVFESSGLPVPEGYGPAGRGKAVFSVSAFMDVIRDRTEVVA